MPDMAARELLTEALSVRRCGRPARRAHERRRASDTQVVFVIEDGKVQQVPVTLGATLDDVDGLARERVVVSPPATMQDTASRNVAVRPERFDFSAFRCSYGLAVEGHHQRARGRLARPSRLSTALKRWRSTMCSETIGHRRSRG